MKETILITGASGLVGRHLTKLLNKEGFRVRTLSRDPGDTSTFLWNPDCGLIDPAAVVQIDHIIHLAGAGIGDKSWTAARKKEILDSRVAGCQLLFHTCQEQGIQLKSFISASAVGFYGSEPSAKAFTESDPAGTGFLASVCAEWEKAALLFEESGVRTVRIRTGIVLSSDGGILPQMALPVRMGLGAAFGNGKQVLPWIHMDDLCQIYLQAIRQESWTGAYNAVAPELVTNRRFTKELARLFHKPFWPLPIPGFPVRWLLGERSELLLKGNAVQSQRLSEKEFRFTSLEAALKDLYPLT